MIDLHGFTIHDAWKRFNSEVESAFFCGKKSLTVVTGKGRIREEFEVWAGNHPYARFAEEIRTGCFKVKLKEAK